MSKKILIIFFSLFFFSIANAEDVFLSLKKNKVNVRYGPSFEFPIKYVYKKIDFPIKQIDKKENFRRIIDINADDKAIRQLMRLKIPDNVYIELSLT